MFDYDFYTNSYGGDTIPSATVFNIYSNKASLFLSKLENIWEVTYPEPISKNFALCCIMDSIYDFKNSSRGKLNSESDGRVSVSYNNDVKFLNSMLDELSVYINIYKGG